MIVVLGFFRLIHLFGKKSRGELRMIAADPVYSTNDDDNQTQK